MANESERDDGVGAGWSDRPCNEPCAVPEAVPYAVPEGESGVVAGAKSGTESCAAPDAVRGGAVPDAVPGEVSEGVQHAAPGGEPGVEPGTAAALLAAGRALFAERGYDGASVRAITAHACANLGAITYHFGSKRELYDRVVEDCLLPLVERVEAIARGDGRVAGPGGTPEGAADASGAVASAGGAANAVTALALPALDRIELVVRGLYDHLRAHPELPRLMVRELAEGGVPPAAVVGPLRRLYQALVALVGEGQARGEIRGGDPLVLVVSVVAQPIHYGLVGPTFVRTISGQDPEDPARWSEIVRSAVAFVRAGLGAGVGEGVGAGEEPATRDAEGGGRC